MLSTLDPVPERMASSLAPEMLATDMADFLVRRGVPFRETHHLAGECVALAEQKGCTLTELSREDLEGVHELFGEIHGSAAEEFTMHASAEARSATGGTSREAVLGQVAEMREWISAQKE